MEKELAQTGTQDYNYAAFMTYEEKTISFLNRYFIFKKVRHISAEMMKTNFSGEKEEEKEKEKEEKKEEKEEKEKEEKKEKKKIKRKIIIE